MRKAPDSGTTSARCPVRYFILVSLYRRRRAIAVNHNPSIFELIEKQEHIETAARALKAIAHPLRLKILCVLGEGEVCVQDIVEAVGTSQSNISQHLAILRDKGVLQTRKDANRVFYRVIDQRTLQLISLMREVFCSNRND